MGTKSKKHKEFEVVYQDPYYINKGRQRYYDYVCGVTRETDLNVFESQEEIRIFYAASTFLQQILFMDNHTLIPMVVEVPIKVTFIDTSIHNGLKIGYEETEKILHLFDQIVLFKKDSPLVDDICKLYFGMCEYILNYIKEKAKVNTKTNTKGE